MADSTAVKGNKKHTSGTSQYNATQFMIRNAILAQVNTAIPVQVTAVEAGGSGSETGYVTVRPLVCQVDGFGETLDPVELFKLPYFRLQGGVVAIVTDPIVGDIGLAVFAKSDCSNVKQKQDKPVQPGSFRKFSMSDGFYLGGFLNQQPTCYLELKQNNQAVLHALGGITIDGDVQINGDVNTSGTLTTASDITSGGKIDAAGVISGDGHNLSTHVHSGVQSGSSTTGGPVG